MTEKQERHIEGLTNRVAELEKEKADMQRIMPVLERMVEMFNQVETACNFFVAAGKVAKWVTITVVSPILAWHYLRKGDFPSVLSLFSGDTR